MKNLELIVARFLDGEMSAEEEFRFQQHLLTSARARDLVREMTLLRREARRLPLLHVPSAATESQLFHRLAQEGFGGQILSNAPSRRARAYSIGAFAVVLLLVLGWSLLPDRGADAPVTWASLSGPFPAWSGVGAGASVSPVAAIDHRGGRNEAATRHFLRRTHSISGSLHLMQPPTTTLTPIVSAPSDTALQPGTEGRYLASHDDVEPSLSSPELNSIVDSSGNQLAPIVDPPGIAWEGREGDGLGLVASVQGGGSRMNRADGLIIKEAQIRVGLEAWDGGRLAVVVGAYPSVTEEKHTNTSFILSSPAGVEHKPTDAPPALHRVILEDEAWFGLALRQRVARLGTVEVEAGGSAGASKSAVHLSEEILVSQRVTSLISLEGGVTLSHMIPFDQSVEHFQVFDSPDRFIYNGVRQQPAFSSVGCQVGVRLSLGSR